MMRRYLNFSILFLSLGALALNASSIVVNGSFELPALANGSWNTFDTIAGWNHVTPGPRIEIQNHVAGNPFDGNQFVELDSTAESTLFQDLPTIVGAQYLLTFAFSPRPGVADNRMEVFWNGASLGTFTASGAALANTNWTVHDFTVAATGTTTRLQFAGIGTSNGYGEYLDAVAVQPIPEPTPMALLVAGLLLFQAARLRRPRK